MKTLLPFLVTICLLTPTLHAQERTASGPLQTEASWNALKSLTDNANNNAKSAHIRLNQIDLCAKKGMFYAPGTGNTDENGCKGPSGNTAASWNRNAGYAWAGPVLLQWGRTCPSNKVATNVALPIPYPTAIMGVVGQLDAEHYGATRANQFVKVINNSVIQVGKSDINGCMNWLATGH